MYEVLSDLSDFTKESIRVFKPYAVDLKYHFDLAYADNPLLIQSPGCIVPFKYSVYDNKFFSIDLFVKDAGFKQMIESVEDWIVQRIQRKYASVVHGRFFVRSLQTTSDSFKLRLRNQNVDSVLLFDGNRRVVDLRNMERNDQVKAIFQFERLIVDGDTYFFNLKALQFKKSVVIDPFTQVECLFKEDEPPARDMTMYRKMMQLGIPRDAVLHKMKMDGLVASDIESFAKPKTTSAPLPPPPPPLPFQGSLKGTAIGKPAFLADIQSGNFTLKKSTAKTPTVSSNNPLTSRVLKFADTSKRVPSLQEILDAKNKLRKAK